MGIGVLGHEAPSLIYRGYLNAHDVARLRRLGGVGNTCAQFFDADGVLLDTDLNQRAISIGLEGLAAIGLVVAAASGRQKAPAILGALRGGHVDVLISDDEAIEAVLELHAQRGNVAR